MNIGQWVKRQGAFRRHIDEEGNERWSGPRWHRVESIVAEDAVVRCGKRMDRVNARGRELEVSPVMPLTRLPGQPQLCNAGCDRPGMVVQNHEADIFEKVQGEAEDDGSTQGELVP